jgi:hypothetical protein
MAALISCLYFNFMMKLKKYSLSMLLIGLEIMGWSQNQVNLINNGANLVIATGTNLYVTGNLTHQNKGRIINNGILKIKGHFVQKTNATYIDSVNASLSFEGNSLQLLSSDTKTPMKISNLIVNNQSALILLTHVVLKKELNLFPNSKLRLYDYNLILDSNITYRQIGSTNYIVTDGDGSVQQKIGSNSTFFYVGNSTYNPIEFFNTGITDTFGIRVLDKVPNNYITIAGTPYGSVKRVWEVNRKLKQRAFAAMDVYWSEKEETTDFDRNKCILNFYETITSPVPIISPAMRISNLWRTSNDNIQLLGNINYFWVEALSSNFSKYPIDGLKVQPNPADNYITLSTSADNIGKLYSISNMSGNIVKTGKITETNQQIDVSDLPAGIYFLNIGAIGTTRTKFTKL